MKILAAIILLQMLVIGTCRANKPIEEIIPRNSSWILNVDGEQSSLSITGGRAGKNHQGVSQIFYEVMWHKQTNDRLRGSSKFGTARANVILDLTRKNGKKEICRSFVLDEDGEFMAGKCDSGGAWYATRYKPVTVPSPVKRAEQDSDAAWEERKQIIKYCRPYIDSAEKYKKQAQSCQNKLTNKGESGNSTKTTSASKEQLYGEFSEFQNFRPCDRCEQTVHNSFPVPGAQRIAPPPGYNFNNNEHYQLNNWLARLNNGLEGTIKKLTTDGQFREYRSGINYCNGNQYCLAAYKHSFIKCTLGLC